MAAQSFQLPPQRLALPQHLQRPEVSVCGMNSDARLQVQPLSIPFHGVLDIYYKKLKYLLSKYIAVYVFLLLLHIKISAVKAVNRAQMMKSPSEDLLCLHSGSTVSCSLQSAQEVTEMLTTGLISFDVSSDPYISLDAFLVFKPQQPIKMLHVNQHCVTFLLLCIFKLSKPFPSIVHK